MRSTFIAFLTMIFFLSMGVDGMETMNKTDVFSAYKVEIRSYDYIEEDEGVKGAEYEIVLYDRPIHDVFCSTTVTTLLAKPIEKNNELLEIVGDKFKYKIFFPININTQDLDCDFLPYELGFSSDISVSTDEILNARNIFNLESEFVEVSSKYKIEFDKDEYFLAMLKKLKYSDLTHVAYMNEKELGFTFRPKNSDIKSITFYIPRLLSLDSSISISFMYYP